MPDQTENHIDPGIPSMVTRPQDAPDSSYDVSVSGNDAIVVVGDNSTFVQNIIKKITIPRTYQWQIFGLLSLAVLTLAGVWFLIVSNQKPSTMSGPFRVAVAGFKVIGKTTDRNLGLEIGEEIRLAFIANLTDEFLGSSKAKNAITIWGPKDGGWRKVGVIDGNNAIERAEAAAALAQRIDANVVIYGVIDTTKPQWEISPEFYVADKQFYNAQEITGQHELGAAIKLPDMYETAGRIALNEKLQTYGQVLSNIVVGLAFYAGHDYTKALVDCLR